MFIFIVGYIIMEKGLPATASKVDNCALARVSDGRGVVAGVVYFDTTPKPPSLLPVASLILPRCFAVLCLKYYGGRRWALTTHFQLPEVALGLFRIQINHVSKSRKRRVRKKAEGLL